MRRIAFAALCACAFAGFPAGGRGQASAPERPLYGGTVVVIDAGGAAAGDPAAAWSRPERQQIALVYPRLLTRTADGGFAPALVRRWSVSRDGLDLVLDCSAERAGSIQTVSAADIAASLKLLLKIRPAPAAARILVDIDGAPAFRNGSAADCAGIEVVTANVVHLRLARPQPFILDALADVNASPSVRADGSPLSPVGSFRRAAGTTFNANPGCREGRPFIDVVQLSSAPPRDTAARIDFRAGIAGSQPLPFPGRRVVWLAINPESQILVTAELRRLALGAIDADGMVRIFFGGEDARLRTLIPPDLVPGGLLTPGPRSGGRGSLQNLTLRIGYARDAGDLKLAAERVRVDLILAGARCELMPLETTVPRLCDLFLQDGLVYSGSPEYSLWSSLVRLQKLTGSEIWLQQPEKDAVRWLLAADRSFTGDGWLLPLFQTRPVISVDARLRSVRFNGDGTLDLDNAWIAPAGTTP